MALPLGERPVQEMMRLYAMADGFNINFIGELFFELSVKSESIPGLLYRFLW